MSDQKPELIADLARHDREALQRILYAIIVSYDQARAPVQHVPPRRLEWLRKPVTLGGDSEILRDRIRIGKQMLQENGWWPDACRQEEASDA